MVKGFAPACLKVHYTLYSIHCMYSIHCTSKFNTWKWPKGFNLPSPEIQTFCMAATQAVNCSTLSSWKKICNHVLSSIYCNTSSNTNGNTSIELHPVIIIHLEKWRQYWRPERCLSLSLYIFHKDKDKDIHF